MKTRKYNTIGGLFRALKSSGANCFTLSDYLSGRLYLRGGWCAVEFSPKLRDELLQLFAGAIWERAAADKALKLEGVKNCGIMRRVAIYKRGGEYSAEYCAGQDYAGEIRFIHKLINKQQ